MNSNFLKRFFACIFIFTVFSFHFAYAKEVSHPVCIERHSDDYPTASMAKLICGVSDVGFGWTEIFWYPTVSQNKVGGALLGPFRMIGRMATGAGELLTFWVPKFAIKKLTPECAMAIVDPKP